jgi:hypothetical protein
MAYLDANSGQVNADNGLSIDSLGNVVLGNDVGDGAMEAALASDREIVDGGAFSLIFSDSAGGSGTKISSQGIELSTLNPAGANPVTSVGWDTVTGELLANLDPVFDNVLVEDVAGDVTDLTAGGIDLFINAADWSGAIPSIDMGNLTNQFSIRGQNDGSDYVDFNFVANADMRMLLSGNFLFSNSSSGALADSGSLVQFFGDVETNQGSIFNGSPHTVVNGSVSGTATFSQPDQGSSVKRVKIYLNALDGVADYTFPTAFTDIPTIITTSGLSGSLISALDVFHVEVTSDGTQSGYLFLEGD